MLNLIGRLKGEYPRAQIHPLSYRHLLLTSIFLVLLFDATALSANVGRGAAFDVARNWVQYSASVLTEQWNGSVSPGIAVSEVLLSGPDTLAFVFQIAPAGYVVVAAYREITPIVAYSTTENLDLDSEFGFARILRSDLLMRVQYVNSLNSLNLGAVANHGAVGAMQANHKRWDLWALDAATFDSRRQEVLVADAQDVGPLLLSTWHQGAPYNSYCPIGNNNMRCWVGCTATATAQIMLYWQWPPAGTGTHGYWWSGDGTAAAQWLTADFGDPYDWGNMLLTYSGGYTQAEAVAVAELCYEVGVAYEMDYGTIGSGAYTDRSMIILPLHFSYMDVIIEEDRSVHTAESWFSMIQPEIDASRPLLYRFYEEGWGAHAIVCDGWRVSGSFNQLHFNYGWGGSYDNWYNVDELYPLTPESIDHQQAYRGIQPRLQIPPEVALTGPVENELNVPPSADISVTFDTEMDQSTLNDSSFIVNGRSSGPHVGIIDYNSATTTATFDPFADFDGGEEVMVLLTKEVSSVEGVNMLRSYQWSFTAAVTISDGNFSPALSYPVVGRPISVFAADLSGDGHTDLAVISEDTSEITLLLNNGLGEFARGSYCQSGEIPSDICAADFDGDGDMDLATSNQASHNISVIKNSGDGSFAHAVLYSTGGSTAPNSIVATDFDGDGRIDLATANSGDCAMSVYLNGGPGSFWRRSDYIIAADEHLSVCSADMDNEGHPDIVTADPQANSIRIFRQQWQEASFGWLACNVGLSPQSVVAADLNVDGYVDIVSVDSISLQLSVSLGIDGITFVPPSLYQVDGNARSVIAADCEGDSDLDLVHTLGNSRVVAVLYNSGDGTFGAPTVFSVGAHPDAVIATDLDGDGDNDLVTANTASSTVSVLINGTSTGTAQTDVSDPPRSFALFQNYPNPFNPSTQIRFALPRAAPVRLDVYNIMGQKVTTLVDEYVEAGHHSVSWDAGIRASGLYVIRIKAGGYIQSKKMLLVK